MVLTITAEELIRIKQALLDEDGGEALRLLRAFHKRLEQQTSAGLKSHLDRR